MPDIKSGGGNNKAFESVILAPRNTQHAIELAFYEVGQSHKKELSIQMLAKDKTGRIYIRRDRAGRHRKHRASGPGQTAANRTGTMRKGRDFQLKGSDQLEFGINNVGKYPAWLEGGTSKMKARPTVGNTVKAEQKNTDNAFKRNLERELV